MPSGMYKRTAEHNKKISESKKGKKYSDELRKKLSEAHKGQVAWNKGKSCSDETRKRISESKIKANYKHSDEWKQKASERMKNMPTEWYKKLSEKKIGHLVSEETKQKISETKIGDKNPSWKGGISCEPYCEIWLDKEFKKDIKQRDNNTCQNPYCYKTNKKLAIHHINYIKKDCRPCNLITLCISCNSRANSNRKYWQILYENKVFGNKN